MGHHVMPMSNIWLPANISGHDSRCYKSYLDRHFLPFFGSRSMAGSCRRCQDWCPSPLQRAISSSVRSTRQLHSIFERAVRTIYLDQSVRAHGVPRSSCGDPARPRMSSSPDGDPWASQLLVATRRTACAGGAIALRPRTSLSPVLCRRGDIVRFRKALGTVADDHQPTEARVAHLCVRLRGWTRSPSTSCPLDWADDPSVQHQVSLRSRGTPSELEWLPLQIVGHRLRCSSA